MQLKCAAGSHVNYRNPNAPGLFGVAFNQKQKKEITVRLLHRYRHCKHRKMPEKESFAGKL